MRENWQVGQTSCHPGPEPGQNPVSAEHAKGLGWHLTCLKIELIIVYVFACVSWVCVWRSENTCGSRFSPSTRQVVGIKLRSSGLAASASTCRAIVAAPLEAILSGLQDSREREKDGWVGCRGGVFWVALQVGQGGAPSRPVR